MGRCECQAPMKPPGDSHLTICRKRHIVTFWQQMLEYIEFYILKWLYD